LHANAPNLASATGSWIFNFAELGDGEDVTVIHHPTGELARPVPVRKVDPRYPPALVEAKVQGEVILYAIVRENGTIDSIQLVHGIDPTLDQNAIEALALWKFEPARRNGVPVALEAVVHIPFRAVAPQY
jgi:TonB family protein